MLLPSVRDASALHETYLTSVIIQLTLVDTVNHSFVLGLY